jgi:6-phosphogluconolactonase
MKPIIKQYADSEALSFHTADLIVATANKAVAKRGCFLLALAGGGTPQRVYELLAQFPHVAEMPWAQTHLMWGDERCVPPDAPGSNYKQVHDTILTQVTLPDTQIHRIRGELEPQAAADDYATQLKQLAEPSRNWPRIDLALMGMGSDGHTASLFPGSDPTDGATQATLAVTADYAGRPAHRVTVAQAVFNDARHVVFLVTGANKAQTLARVLNGPDNPVNLPAQRIRPKNGIITWLIDTPAGSEL